MGIVFSFFKDNKSPSNVFFIDNNITPKQNIPNKNIILYDINPGNGKLSGNIYTSSSLIIPNNFKKLSNDIFIQQKYPENDNLQLFLTLILNGQLISGNLTKFSSNSINTITNSILQLNSDETNATFSANLNNLTLYNETKNTQIIQFFNDIQNNWQTKNLKIKTSSSQFTIYYSYIITTNMYDCIYLINYIFPYFTYAFYLNEKNNIMKNFKNINDIPLIINVFNLYDTYITKNMNNKDFKFWIVPILQKYAKTTQPNVHFKYFLKIVKEIYKELNYQNFPNSLLLIIPLFYKYNIIYQKLQQQKNTNIMNIIKQYKEIIKSNINFHELFQLFTIITYQESYNNLTKNLTKDFAKYIKTNKIDLLLKKVSAEEHPINGNNIIVKNSLIKGKSNKTIDVFGSKILPLLNSNKNALEILKQTKYKNGELNNYKFNPVYKKNNKSIIDSIKELYKKSYIGESDEDIKIQIDKDKGRIINYFTDIFNDKYNKTQINEITQNFFSIAIQITQQGIKSSPQDWMLTAQLSTILDDDFYKMYFRMYQMQPYYTFLVDGNVMILSKIREFFQKKYGEKNSYLLFFNSHNAFLPNYMQVFNKYYNNLNYANYKKTKKNYLKKLQIIYKYSDYSNQVCKQYYQKYGINYMIFALYLPDLITLFALLTKDKKIMSQDLKNQYGNSAANMGNIANKKTIIEFISNPDTGEVIYTYNLIFFYLLNLSSNDIDKKCLNVLKLLPEFYKYLINNPIITDKKQYMKKKSINEERFNKIEENLKTIITQPLLFSNSIS